MTSLPVLYDHRETKSGIPDALTAAGVPVAAEQLPAGDYVLSDRLAVERKTGSDLAASIKDRRIFEQIDRLTVAYPAVVLLVEGPPVHISEASWKGALGRVLLTGVSVLLTDHPDDSANWIARLHRLEGKGPSTARGLPRVRRPTDDLDRTSEDVLSCLPGISTVGARRLLAQFGSLAAVFAASETELRQVVGVGQSAARRWRACSAATRDGRLTSMQFKLEGSLADYALHPGSGGPLVFDIGGAHQLHVVVWTDHELDVLRYCVDAALQPPGDVLASFESLAAGRYPSDSLPKETLSRGRVETAGTEIGRMAHMSLMPSAFQAFATELGGELRDTVVTILGLLRWRSGELGRPLPDVAERFQWRLGTEEWRGLPGLTSAHIVAPSFPELSAAARADLARLHEQGDVEPFAYELIREAWALRETNPRLALITAITALEIAVKQFIARRVPGTDWLVENMPVPDVIKLLREYLPTLDPPHGSRLGAGRFEELPDDLWRLLLKRRNQRNDVIHKPTAYESVERRRRAFVTAERAETAVLAVREVLYRIDRADGHAWAARYFGSSTRPAHGLGYRHVE